MYECRINGYYRVYEWRAKARIKQRMCRMISGHLCSIRFSIVIYWVCPIANQTATLGAKDAKFLHADIDQSALMRRYIYRHFTGEDNFCDRFAKQQTPSEKGVHCKRRDLLQEEHILVFGRKAKQLTILPLKNYF